MTACNTIPKKGNKPKNISPKVMQTQIKSCSPLTLKCQISPKDEIDARKVTKKYDFAKKILAIPVKTLRTSPMR